MEFLKPIKEESETYNADLDFNKEDEVKLKRSIS